MRRMLAAVMLVGIVVAGLGFARQIAPALAQENSRPVVIVGPTVAGVVTQKFTVNDDASYIIAVDGTPYEVPLEVYLGAQVGSVVRFDGSHWSVVGGPGTTRH